MTYLIEYSRKNIVFAVWMIVIGCMVALGSYAVGVKVGVSGFNSALMEAQEQLALGHVRRYKEIQYSLSRGDQENALQILDRAIKEQQEIVDQLDSLKAETG